MEEEQLKKIASQLRQPQGEDGLVTADMMNKGNMHIHRGAMGILNVAEGDVILEIGMGNGFYVKELFSKRMGIHYTGCDYSKLMVEEAIKLNEEWIARGKAEFIHGEIAVLPFDDASFNKIVTINTVYFWDDEVAALKEIIRVLKPNGIFIVAFRPKYYTEKYPFIEYGFNQFSAEDVVQLLSENGFSDATAFVNREPDFDMNGVVMKMENVVVVGRK